MSTVGSPRGTTEPPTRALRLLADLWWPAAVLFGLTTAGLVATTVQAFTGLVTSGVGPGAPVVVRTAGVLTAGAAAVVLGRITWRLAVEVPRTVRAWDEALDERREALGA